MTPPFLSPPHAASGTLGTWAVERTCLFYVTLLWYTQTSLRGHLGGICLFLDLNLGEVVFDLCL